MNDKKEILILKEGEVALKGLNRRSFEETMVKTLKYRLSPLGKFDIKVSQSMLYIEPLSENIDMDEAEKRASRVFGANAVCRALAAEKTDIGTLSERILAYLDDELSEAKTFKVFSRRSDKSYPLKSPEICREVGGYILAHRKHLSVDVNDPDVSVYIEVREKYAYIHTGNKPAAGGIPVGTSGKGLLLLSGGIDSPVAGYMMAKRGVKVSAIHYVSPPYTSERAKQKVVRLCEKITDYCGDMTFYCVPFTKIEEALRDNCPEEYLTIIMRRLMMEIAQRIAERDGIQALITGESVGQVASQTMGALVCTDEVCRMPVLRPVIGADKTEIIEIARKIDTYDISIEPYEDCCTVFTPKHPKTKPVLELVKKAQNMFDFEPLIKEAVEGTETEYIKMNL